MEGEEQHGGGGNRTQWSALLAISLHTVSIIVENRGKSLIINTLLDDGSTQRYLNADIASKLDLHVEKRKNQVNVINGTVVTFETAPVEYE